MTGKKKGMDKEISKKKASQKAGLKRQSRDSKQVVL